MVDIYQETCSLLRPF